MDNLQNHVLVNDLNIRVKMMFKARVNGKMVLWAVPLSEKDGGRIGIIHITIIASIHITLIGSIHNGGDARANLAEVHGIENMGTNGSVPAIFRASAIFVVHHDFSEYRRFKFLLHHDVVYNFKLHWEVISAEVNDKVCLPSIKAATSMATKGWCHLC